VIAVASHARDIPARRTRKRGGAGRGALIDGRGDLMEIQRVRMIAALAEVARERGVAATTVAHITARSGVSRRTFYELFHDRDDCFRAGFDQAVAHAAQRVVPAFEAGRTWREHIRGGLAALLEFLEDEPDLGALCVVDALGAGREALARRAAVVDVLIAAVEEGGAKVRSGSPPSRLTAEGIVGAVLAILHARLAQERTPSMAGLLGPLTAMIVLPYLGRAAAAQEAAKAAPPRRRAGRPNRNPLRDLDMRLTYRTVRVLAAIAAHPGASNRRIADAAGVVDQGQISKLLARLEHVGLIGNAVVGLGVRGEPNAWTLTGRGEDVARAIRERTS
jgi:AcrR family transcriptional regulator